MMYHYKCHPMVIKKLIEREISGLKEQIELYKNHKIAIFAAGNYGQRFYHRLKKYGIEAEFFIDNNPKLHEYKICDKPVLFKPWEAEPDFARKYFVLISTKASWTKEILLQLKATDIPHISSDAYEAVLLWEQAKNVVGWLDDDYSKASYLGLIWYWLTHDSSFFQLSNNQYFDVIQFPAFDYEIIADLGAYVGDTSEEFVRRSMGICNVYAFEPDEYSYQALALRFKRLKSEWNLKDNGLIAIQAGSGAETGYQCFKNLEMQAGSSFSDTGGKEVMVYALDDYFKDKEPPTLIKADIEGSEINMLKGAAGIIKNHKPQMAICIYHFPDDFVMIPQMIKNLNDNYRFAVRTYSVFYKDTVLYCY